MPSREAFGSLSAEISLGNQPLGKADHPVVRPRSAPPGAQVRFPQVTGGFYLLKGGLLPPVKPSALSTPFVGLPGLILQAFIRLLSRLVTLGWFGNLGGWQVGKIVCNGHNVTCASWPTPTSMPHSNRDTHRVGSGTHPT